MYDYVCSVKRSKLQECALLGRLAQLPRGVQGEWGGLSRGQRSHFLQQPRFTFSRSEKLKSIWKILKSQPLHSIQKLPLLFCSSIEKPNKWRTKHLTLHIIRNSCRHCPLLPPLAMCLSPPPSPLSLSIAEQHLHLSHSIVCLSIKSSSTVHALVSTLEQRRFSFQHKLLTKSRSNRQYLLSTFSFTCRDVPQWTLNMASIKVKAVPHTSSQSPTVLTVPPTHPHPPPGTWICNTSCGVERHRKEVFASRLEQSFD